jgi:hypothetical protein
MNALETADEETYRMMIKHMCNKECAPDALTVAIPPKPTKQ